MDKDESHGNLLESDDDGDLENFGADEELMRQHFGNVVTVSNGGPPAPALPKAPAHTPRKGVGSGLSRPSPRTPKPAQPLPRGPDAGVGGSGRKRRGPRSRAEEEAQRDSDDSEDDRGGGAADSNPHPTTAIITTHLSGEPEEDDGDEEAPGDVDGADKDKEEEEEEGEGAAKDDKDPLEKDKEDTEDEKEEEEEDDSKSSTGLDSLLGVRHEENLETADKEDEEEEEEDEEEDDEEDEEDQAVEQEAEKEGQQADRSQNEDFPDDSGDEGRKQSMDSADDEIRKESMDSKENDDGDKIETKEVDGDPKSNQTDSHKGFQLGISVDSRKKSKKLKEKEGKEAKLKIRYFVIRSSNHRNVTASVEKGVWATTYRNKDKFNQAFRQCDSVILIFSVNKSQHFQGYARMSSEITMGGVQEDWVDRKQGEGLTDSFKVDWLKLYDLPISSTEHIKNALNGGGAVWFSRDGQEVDRSSGEALCKLIDAGAAHTIVKEGEASATGTGAANGPAATSGDAAKDGSQPQGLGIGTKPCFRFRQFGHCSYADACKYRHDSVPQQQIAQGFGAQAGETSIMQGGWQQAQDPRISGQAAGLESRKRKSSGKEDEDITNMTYEEYVAKHQRLAAGKAPGFPGAHPQHAQQLAAAHHHAGSAQAAAVAHHYHQMAYAHQQQHYGGGVPLAGYGGGAAYPGAHQHYQAQQAPPDYYAGAGWWGGSPYPPHGYGGGGYPYGY